jgi:hypothetical protein
VAYLSVTRFLLAPHNSKLATGSQYHLAFSYFILLEKIVEEDFPFKIRR